MVNYIPNSQEDLLKRICDELKLKDETIKRLSDKVTALETGLSDNTHYVTNSIGTIFYKVTIVNGKVTAIT